MRRSKKENEVGIVNQAEQKGGIKRMRKKSEIDEKQEVGRMRREKRIRCENEEHKEE